MKSMIGFTNHALLSMVILLCSFNSQAGVADLSLAIEFDGIAGGVDFQQLGTFRLTVTNNGPDAAGMGSTLAEPISIFTDFVELTQLGSEMIYQLDQTIDQNCGYGVIAVDPRPGDPPGFVYVFRTPEISPNDSVTCHGLYFVNFELGIRNYDFRVSGFVEDSDPDFQNNSAPVTFGIAPQSVPFLSPLGLLLVLLMSLGVGLCKINALKARA